MYDTEGKTSLSVKYLSIWKANIAFKIPFSFGECFYHPRLIKWGRRECRNCRADANGRP